MLLQVGGQTLPKNNIKCFRQLLCKPCFFLKLVIVIMVKMGLIYVYYVQMNEHVKYAKRCPAFMTSAHCL